MESGGKYIPAHGIAQHGFQAFFQLSGGFIGKGNGQHIPRAGRGNAHQRHQGLRNRLAAHDGGAQLLQITLRNRAADLFGAIGAAKTNDIGNAVDQNGGFAGACTCQDQQRAFGGKHSLLLHRVQLSKAGSDIAVPQGQKFSGNGIGHNEPVLILYGRTSPEPCRAGNFGKRCIV